MSAYEMPTETGEARLYRLRDRRRRLAEAAMVALAILGVAAWLVMDGTAGEAGWAMLWLVPLIILAGIVHVALDLATLRAMRWLASPLTRLFDPHSYSRSAPAEPAPDWSHAERIPEDER